MSNINPVQGRTTSTNADGWAFAAFLITIVPLTIFNGWVLSVIWNWFIPVIFQGAPVLTIGQALGLSLVITYFTSAIATKRDKTKSLGALVAAMLIRAIVRGAVFLGLGFIYQFFV